MTSPSAVNASSNMFVHVQGGLLNELNGGIHNNPGVPFNVSWMAAYRDAIENASFPTHLPLPSFVDVFEYAPPLTAEAEMESCGGGVGEAGENGGGADGFRGDRCRRTMEDDAAAAAVPDLREVGRAACDVVDDMSADSDAVLFRNLDRRIRTAEDFAAFWEGCHGGGGRDEEESSSESEEQEQEPASSSGRRSRSGWTPTEYVSLTTRRSQLGGIDLAYTAIPPHDYVNVHNEMVYNPKPAGRIAFYCLSDAPEGGETLLSRNSDYDAYVPYDLRKLMWDHGGLRHRRAFTDVRGRFGRNKRYVPWQEKTGTHDRAEAVKFFTDVGFTHEQITFDEYGSLIVENVKSGYNDDGHWFSFVSHILGDGTKVSERILDRLRVDEMGACSAVKLRPGDWIVLNNRKVMHGRLPFRDTEDQRRTILTVYTE